MNVAATTFAIEVFVPYVVQYRANPVIRHLNRFRWVVVVFRWAVVLVLMILKMELEMREIIGGLCPEK